MLKMESTETHEAQACREDFSLLRDELQKKPSYLVTLQCTLGEIHFLLLSPDEKNTELKKILTKIHLFPLDYFYSNIGTKL